MCCPWKGHRGNGKHDANMVMGRGEYFPVMGIVQLGQACTGGHVQSSEKPVDGQVGRMFNISF